MSYWKGNMAFFKKGLTSVPWSRSHLLHTQWETHASTQPLEPDLAPGQRLEVNRDGSAKALSAGQGGNTPDTPWKSGVSPPGLAEQESYQLTHTAGHIANHPKTLLLCTAFRGPQTLQMLDG